MAEGRQRLDRWLFFSRAVKSRSLAARLVQAGRIRINRDKATQAADQVKPGDVLTIALNRRILIYRVRDSGKRRGPPEEAHMLYDDLSPPVPDGAAANATVPSRDPGSGRPTKRERRDTDRLRGSD